MPDHARPLAQKEEGRAAAPEGTTARPSDRGGDPARGRHPEPRVDAQLAAVETARKSISIFKGCVYTREVAGLVAGLIWLDFPHMAAGDIEELVFPKVVRGIVLDDAVILDRARAIATVAVQ